MRSTIICVDDEWSILKCLGDQLKLNFGKEYDIELVNSGEAALALCSELKADNQAIALIISDQCMAGMGGDTLLIQLHTLYPQTLKIMLTGQTDPASLVNVVNQAALYRYIRKPWDETDLILTVSEALRRFQQEQLLVEQNQLLKATNARLESSLALLLATLEATADGILVLDNAGKIASFNQKLLSIFRLSPADIDQKQGNLVQAVLEQLTAADAMKFQNLFTRVNREKHECLKLQDGRLIEYYLQPYYLEGESIGGVLSFRDVTQVRQAAALMQYQALHDPLTNLPNRVLLGQKLAMTLQDAASNKTLFAVMFLDLDRFKEVNDTLGHAIGDLLLQNVVQRWMGCLRDVDVLARWGGDEFVLLVPQLRHPDDACDIAGRLIEAIKPEFRLQDACLQVTASIGIALYPGHGLDSQTLLQQADEALYRAKKAGRNNYQCYLYSGRS